MIDWHVRFVTKCIVWDFGFCISWNIQLILLRFFTLCELIGVVCTTSSSAISNSQNRDLDFHDFVPRDVGSLSYSNNSRYILQVYLHIYRASTNMLNIDTFLCLHTCQLHDTSYAIKDYKETEDNKPTLSVRKGVSFLYRACQRRMSNNKRAKTKTGMHRLRELLFDTCNIYFNLTIAHVCLGL